MKFIELFSGIGGFRYGLEMCNRQHARECCKGEENLSSHNGGNGKGWRSNTFTCIFANDNNKYACQVYRKNFGKEELYEGDITKIIADDIPDFDLLCGGFPCQAFSIAGKRKGFEDTRGTLFFDIARILAAKRPRYLLLENVKGLLSHDDGHTFRTILWVLHGLRYDVQWQVLNSKDFGVPQNRERVFIIGHLRGERRPEVFPIREINKNDTKQSTIHGRNSISRTLTAHYGDVSGDSTKIQILDKTGKVKSKKIASTLTGGGHSGGNHSDMDLLEITKNKPDAQRIYDSNEISKTLKGEGGGQGAKTGLYAMRWQRTEKGKEARRESQANGKDYTPFSEGCREVVPVPGKNVGAITAQAVAKDSLIGNEMQIRRLTPTECERLQAFPDGWTEGISDSQRYKCLGNALTTSVVKEIGKRLINTLHLQKNIID